MTNAELKSALMDTDEATKAADAEHTEVADVANLETQSIYAWSQDDDADELARRSWKIPVAIAVAAAAAVTVSAYLAWPQQTSPTQPAASPLPAQTLSPDVRFINLINDGLQNEPGFPGARQGDPAVIATGHSVCEKMSELYPSYGPAARNQIVQLMVDAGAPSRNAATTVERAAETAYCPQYAPGQ